MVSLSDLEESVSVLFAQDLGDRVGIAFHSSIAQFVNKVDAENRPPRGTFEYV